MEVASPPSTPRLDHDSNFETTRQTKKLQLRKSGFKAKDIPQRHVTPKTSGSWSRRNPSSTWSAQSNTATGQESVPSDTVEPLQPLRTINNSTRRRKKNSRPRVDDVIPIYQDENVDITINSMNPGKIGLDSPKW